MNQDETEDWTDRFQALSPQQLELLSLAAQNPASKVIAQQTGYTAGTIDKYLSETARILGVPDRRRAIKAFENWRAEESGNSGNSGNPSKTVGYAIDPAADMTTIGSIDTGVGSTGRSSNKRFWLALPPIGGPINDLTLSDRLLAACRVAFIGTLLLIAVAMILKQAFTALS